MQYAIMSFDDPSRSEHPIKAKTDKSAFTAAKKEAARLNITEYAIIFYRASDGCRGSIGNVSAEPAIESVIAETDCPKDSIAARAVAEKIYRQEFARKGGQAKSPAKTKAARENAKKGGRPRKVKP